ncbi:MAG: D-ribose pyranase [Bacillota bacterium]|nr:D-ribose pyranase [Bacillota bacterium]
MKKGKLLNSRVSSIVSKLGHTDTITVCDCGLPIDANVERIDLALTHGIPGFIETLEVICSEQFVEEVTIAEEFEDKNIIVFRKFIQVISKLEKEQKNKIKINIISHNEFKEETKKSKAIIRTGEITPYSNVILHSGVVF